MVGLRLYGYSQSKRPQQPSRRGSLAPSISSQTLERGPKGITDTESEKREQDAKDVEYKLLYHQVFKAAVFALRAHIRTKPLEQSAGVRDVVDKLLLIFCTDPLASSLGDDNFGAPGAREEGQDISPFAKRRSDDGAMNILKPGDGSKDQ